MTIGGNMIDPKRRNRYYMDRSDGRMYEIIVETCYDADYYMSGVDDGFSSRPGGLLIPNDYKAKSYYAGFYRGVHLYECRKETEEAPFCAAMRPKEEMNHFVASGQMQFSYDDDSWLP
jgi:hypothetical protein